MSIILYLTLFAFTAVLAQATEFHVATKGDDRNSGTKVSPFRTVQRAANAAQPGDVITVHEGVYRERVNPPRGGTSETKRISYQAAPGEQVVITGSEPVKSWEKVSGDTWRVTIPNSFFGQFNPYANLIHGDWFNAKGRKHHTGCVYLNGDWFIEAARLDDVLKPAGKTPLWFATVTNCTEIYAQFPNVNPNEQSVEINVRQTVFYPRKTGINYLTVRGFDLRNAATPWAPPTAEQIGLIGTDWSKGWIIESNRISHSRCSGITLGKCGDAWDNASATSVGGYMQTIQRALTNGWNGDTVGHHIVRNNEISHCEQTGICGSLGAIFSTISGNTIHDIHVQQQFGGDEMGGIKFHAAIDVVISGNHIYRAHRGVWLDWMGQGARISGNLFHDNPAEELYTEVDHGPFLVDNNIFLSPRNLTDVSEGGAYVHNLMTGTILNYPDHGRSTPFLLPHSVTIAGLTNIAGGDHRFYNNIFVGDGGRGDEPKNSKSNKNGFGLCAYDPRDVSIYTGGNVYLHGARPWKNETDATVRATFHLEPKLVQRENKFSLELKWDGPWQPATNRLVTTALLGKAKIPNAAYENANGSPLRIDTDYFGNKRNEENPFPGPIENPDTSYLKLKVW